MEYHKILTLEPLKGTFLIDGILTEKTEVFKDIPDYKGKYQISTFGRVKSLSRTIIRSDGIKRNTKCFILKQSFDNARYLKIRLSSNNNQKTFNISPLMAITFLGHKTDKKSKIIVDHKNNIKTNNFLWNIQVISQRLNTSKDKTNVSSKYTGVCWDKHRSKWIAQIYINGKHKFLGRFSSEKSASNAYKLELLS